MEKYRKLSFNYHQIHSSTVSLTLFQKENLLILPSKSITCMLRIIIKPKLHSISLPYWATARKPTKQPVHPAKTQISLGICPVWSESSRCTLRVAKDPILLHADIKDSDQTGRMPKLIWVFTGHIGHFVGFVMRQLNLKHVDYITFQ